MYDRDLVLTNVYFFTRYDFLAPLCGRLMSCGVDAEVCAEMLEHVFKSVQNLRQCCEGLSSKF